MSDDFAGWLLIGAGTAAFIAFCAVLACQAAFGKPKPVRIIREWTDGEVERAVMQVRTKHPALWAEIVRRELAEEGLGDDCGHALSRRHR